MPVEYPIKRLSCDEFDAFESTIDTEYFGVVSAKVILKKACLSIQRQDELLGFLKNFEFITITNIANDPSNNHWLGKRTKAFLADVNIQFGKKATSTEEKTDDFIMISDNFAGSGQIVNIAETSFKYSRFLNDPNLPLEKARQIYGDIAKNSFQKTGRFFATITRAETIAGFLLFSINASNFTSTIELVAIDQNHKGRGIGRSLIRALETYVHGKGVAEIRVGTQLNNIDALKFYTTCGFKVRECNSIYHYWPSRS
jgi:dTDP-4-amino-4,6-dideoxy-D-galactose acyltransferase